MTRRTLSPWAEQLQIPANVGQFARLSRRAFARTLLGGVATMSLAARSRAADSSMDTVRLGAVMPLTGPDAAVGVQQQRGLRFGVERINASGGVDGRKLEILYEDNQGKPDQSVISFNKLTDLSGVPVVFSAYSGPTLAMAPLATRKEIVLVNGGAQADRLAKASPYLFNTIPVAGDEIAVLAKYLFGAGKRKAAVLYENNAGGTPGRDDFIASFTKLGGEIVGQEPSSFSQTDYRPALLKLTDAKPDVLFVMLTDGLGPLAEQLFQMKPPYVIAGTSFFNDPDALHNPGSNGWLHTQVRIAAPPDVAEAFKAMFNVEMEFWGSQYYNATLIIAQAIKKVFADKQTLSGANIRKAIFAIRKFDVMLPAIFDSNTATMEIDIVQTQDGHHHFLQSFTAD
jgi:branched-chain amino acid transport system substrate-binding protein